MSCSDPTARRTATARRAATAGRTVTALRTVAVLSWREYRAVYPLRVVLASSLPRAILQTLFVAYLGLIAAGPAGRDFALVGGAMQVITIATVIKAGDILVDDRIFGTIYRMRLAWIPLPVVAATRWWVFTAEGVLGGLVAATATCLLFGRPALMAGIWAAAGLVLLVALSTSALGMAVAAIAMTQRIDSFITNLVSYLLLALTGAVAPLERLPDALEALAHGLPMTNGLLAVRGALAGGPWLGHAAAEAAVGLGWLAVAAAVLTLQARQARTHDTDGRI
ncbi:ABC transporter permease [Nonomuraea sp. NPDC049480]|uniref:ABC transporter permease n=1 Tax=Nonomuraea sp. NPDC049480 TaxID=3364353 RepID=UPI0037A34BF5